MKKLALILPILLAFACSSQPSADSSDDLVNVTYGSIVRLDSFPSRLVSPRNIDIWLPIGYSKDKCTMDKCCLTLPKPGTSRNGE